MTGGVKRNKRHQTYAWLLHVWSAPECPRVCSNPHNPNTHHSSMLLLGPGHPRGLQHLPHGTARRHLTHPTTDVHTLHVPAHPARHAARKMARQPPKGPACGCSSRRGPAYPLRLLSMVQPTPIATTATLSMHRHVAAAEPDDATLGMPATVHQLQLLPSSIGVCWLALH